MLQFALQLEVTSGFSSQMPRYKMPTSDSPEQREEICFVNYCVQGLLNSGREILCRAAQQRICRLEFSQQGLNHHHKVQAKESINADPVHLIIQVATLDERCAERA